MSKKNSSNDEKKPLLVEDYVRGNPELAKAKEAVLERFNAKRMVLQEERTAMFKQVRDFYWITPKGDIRLLHKRATWVSAEDVHFMRKLSENPKIQALNESVWQQQAEAGDVVEVEPPELDKVELTDVKRK